jgi:chemosensory pili system protein ChpA (sensor histidine kinase/response regulator)
MFQERLEAVLIVDDAPHFRDSVRLLLRSFGFQVATARDGQEALDYLKNRPLPNLIILDLCMPGMNGYRFREEQLSDTSLASIPVIVASSEANAEEEEALRGVGAFFSKGTNPMVLVGLVQKHCHSESLCTSGGGRDVSLGERDGYVGDEGR